MVIKTLPSLLDAVVLILGRLIMWCHASIGFCRCDSCPCLVVDILLISARLSESWTASLAMFALLSHAGTGLLSHAGSGMLSHAGTGLSSHAGTGLLSLAGGKLIC